MWFLKEWLYGFILFSNQLELTVSRIEPWTHVNDMEDIKDRTCLHNTTKVSETFERYMPRYGCVDFLPQQGSRVIQPL